MDIMLVASVEKIFPKIEGCGKKGKVPRHFLAEVNPILESVPQTPATCAKWMTHNKQRCGMCNSTTILQSLLQLQPS